MGKKTNEVRAIINFDTDLEIANNIEDLQKRLFFLLKRKKEVEQYKYPGLLTGVDLIKKEYLKKSYIEIGFVEDLISRKTLKIPANAQPQKNKNAPAKQVEPIKWQKNSVLLAYLINELKTYGFIDETNIWAICEQLFVDKKGKPIKATTFSSMVKNYENNQTIDNTRGKPKNHNEISTLIEIIKSISKEHNS